MSVTPPAQKTEPLGRFDLEAQATINRGNYQHEEPIQLKITLRVPRHPSVSPDEASRLLISVAKRIQEVAGEELSKLVSDIEGL